MSARDEETLADWARDDREDEEPELSTNTPFLRAIDESVRVPLAEVVDFRPTDRICRCGVKHTGPGPDCYLCAGRE